jgi:hypothetical protein
VRWFRSLSPEERLRVLQNHLDLLHSLGPDHRRTHDSHDPAVVRVIRLPWRASRPHQERLRRGCSGGIMDSWTTHESLPGATTS